jgi:hypothetical protein
VGISLAVTTDEPPEEEDAPEPSNRIWTLADFEANACKVYRS